MLLLTAADIQIKRILFELDFETKAMKLSILFVVGSFAHGNQAGSMVSRHWAMPNYRRMGNIEVVKPTYNRLSHQRNKDLKRMLESLDGHGRRISSIWHSYTQNLY